MKNKSPDPDGSTYEFCQSFKEEISSVFHSLLQKFEEEEVLLNLFCEISITSKKTVQENYGPVFFTNINAEILQPNISKSHPPVYPTICISMYKIHHDRVEFFLGNMKLFNIWKPISITHHIWRLWKKNQNHMILTINWCRKGIWQNSTSIYDINSKKTGNRREFPIYAFI